MKKLTLLLGLLLATTAMAKPVSNWEQATDLAIEFVKKHHSELTSLSMNCLSFYESDENKELFEVDVHEKHNKECGGDPETAPRLFSIQIDKNTGNVKHSH